MSDAFITESGMTFGPHAEGYRFDIEQSATLSQLNKRAKTHEGIKPAEFLLLRTDNGKPTIWIIEAKSSAPHPRSQEDFSQYVTDIKEKFVNSLDLFMALYLNRHPTSDELPTAFRSLDMASVDFRLALIIKGFDKAWLPPLQDAFSKALKLTVKIWALPPASVLVINDSIARAYGLLKPATPPYLDKR
ncbi:hypothetical protein [Methylovulum psychrotolerans]|uniref:Uncharacterized protein n=1 Tax=Methylovulum psychrotolerans TaxID=1704499 RepID=A0A1Z4C2N5_9GAMM|nr:hypothetical protein [Methylovulum psychrotolerans]ASF47793.1 hypothetical protein CEK71_17925 [Methylovulum psychrotolerans]